LIILVIAAETGCLKNITPVFPYATSTPTLSNTPTFILTHTPTNTPTRAFDPTPVNPNSFTPTPTITPHSSTVPTLTPTDSPTQTFTPTVTITFTTTSYSSTVPTLTPTVSPTQTFTPKPTITPNSSTVPTLTPTDSPTQTFTPTVTITCTTISYLGDTVPGAQSGILGTLWGTYAQRYDLATAGTVQSIWIEPTGTASVKVGIYTGNDTDNWPETLLYESGKVTITGLSSIPVPNINLPAGTYWLAFQNMNTAPDGYEGASGSTALMSTARSLYFPTNWSICLNTPGPTPANTPACTPPTNSTTGQILIYAQICN